MVLQLWAKPMQPQKIDAERAGLKLIRPAFMFLVALAASAAPLPAQGPEPLGLRQPIPKVAVPNRLSTITKLTDTVHVKPNHWKRGALIGFVATALPVAISAAVGGCGGWVGEGGACAITKAAITVSVGALGGLVGGLVGSFFPKGESKTGGN
ncbi:MAG: hypothetical protein SFU84_07975 [Gemmatimonadales bacterium]|nr:hypothetical protein [Gemmatimonadales bacterium]